MNRRAGFSLIETLVYLAVLTVLFAAAFPAYFRCQQGSADLRRHAGDVIRTMQAGERWRQDVRAATGPIRVGEAVVVIPRRDGDVSYELVEGALRRRQGQQASSIVLANVKSSVMSADARRRVTAWRWELELAGHQKEVKVRPLFSFVAVPGEARP